MNNHFIKGTINALTYYFIGASLALLAYFFFDEDVYTLERGSRLHHLVFTITWIGGCLWAVFALFSYIRGHRKHYYLGVLLVNILALMGVFTWVSLQPSPTEAAIVPGPANTAEVLYIRPIEEVQRYEC